MWRASQGNHPQASLEAATLEGVNCVGKCFWLRAWAGGEMRSLRLPRCARNDRGGITLVRDVREPIVVVGLALFYLVLLR